MSGAGKDGGEKIDDNFRLWVLVVGSEQKLGWGCGGSSGRYEGYSLLFLVIFEKSPPHPPPHRIASD